MMTLLFDFNSPEKKDIFLDCLKLIVNKKYYKIKFEEHFNYSDLSYCVKINSDDYFTYREMRDIMLLYNRMRKIINNKY